MTILLLVFLRLSWRMMQGIPDELPSHKKWERLLSTFVHYALYVLMMAMPLSGWLMSSASGFPVSVFGLFSLPDLIGKDQELGKILNSAHSLIAWGIIVLVSLHVFGALKHHFWDKDKTLRRMLPFGCLAFVMVAPSAFAQDIQKWEIIPEESSIAFIAKWESSDVRGEFLNFGGEIAFDENDLENSYAHIEIDMMSFDTGYAERDEEIAGPLWFDLQNYKKAIFKTNTIEQKQDGYIADGALSIKNNEVLVSLPFTLMNKEQGKKIMIGQTTLKRLDFNIGQQGWKSTDIIANDVIVKIELAVQPADPLD